jgi:hypothetical protein
MPDGINAAVQSMKTTQTQSSVNRVFSEPEQDQLPTRDHPLLSAGEIGNRRIRPVSMHFPAHTAGKCRLGGHRTMVSPPASQVVRCV